MRDEEIRLFGRGLRALQRDLGAQWKDDASCCGITVAQCHALLEVAESGGMSLVELAGVLGLDTSTLSRTVDSMVQAKLVKRSVNPDDRRYVCIALTRRGRAVRANIDRTFNDHFAEVMGAIPEAKRRQVVESLAIMVDVIHESRKRDAPREEPGT